jgi:hypothetical protein
MDQEFHADVEKPMDPNFEPLRSIDFDGHGLAKVPKSNYRHGGALRNRSEILH